MSLEGLNKTIKNLNGTAGKITVSLSLAAAFVLIFTLLFYGGSQDPIGPMQVDAQNDEADTFVTVLNTAPSWTATAVESPASHTTIATITNSGDDVTWTAVATDSNGDSYYLLICDNGNAPTESDPPECDGGSGNRWARSPLTASGAGATAVYTTSESNANQSNDWWAWICDNDATTPQCNNASGQGDGDGDGDESPFFINFRPEFTGFTDDSPVNPGGTASWSSTATDSSKNTVVSFDVQLFVCQTNSFTAGTGCGGTEWCSSAFAASDPSCNDVIENPPASGIYPDGDHDSFGFLQDEVDHAASGGAHSTNSTLTVNNVAPAVGAASISLNDTDDAGALTLTTPGGETTGFSVTFTVTDDNSCQNLSGGDEIASSIANVYSARVTAQAACDEGSEWDEEYCYPAAIGASTWNLSCSQDAGTCSGTTDNSVDWTCTFPLWFNADASDPGAEYPGLWLASIQADDDDSLNSGLVEASTGNTLLSFLASSLDATTINYGSLEAGQDTGTTNAATNMNAEGNVGMNQDLEGTHMCTTFNFSNPPDYGCTRGSTTETIPSAEQRYSLSNTTAYSSAVTLPDDQTGGGAQTLHIAIPKTRDHLNLSDDDTWWGIAIPSTITLAGDYQGLDFISAVASPSNSW
ncbi:MAG: hypothetical protein R3251_02590 [Candidatus Spechtbacterales bacterium]|nr:hypothetical protein [Candidatus Spechtbacterales bacterium]